MAENDIPIDRLKEGADAATKFGTATSAATEKLVDFFKAASHKETLDDLMRTLGDVDKVTQNVQAMFARIGINDALMDITASLLPLTSALPKASEAFGKMGQDGEFASTRLAESIKLVGPQLDKFGVAGKSFHIWAEGAAQSGQASLDLQRNIIGLYAASGNLNRLLDDSGERFRNMDDVAARWASSTYATAQATGVSSDKINALMMGLKNIPGVFDEMGSKAGVAGESVSNVVDILRVQSATGMTTGEITDQLNFAYSTLGKSGKGALEVIAEMADVSKRTLLPMQAVTEYTKNAGNSFKYFGDNSDAALKILTRMSPALKEMGLGYSAIQDTIGGVVGSLADLNIGQRAFISQGGGGPGGLMGAYQMQYKMTQGRTGEVFADLQKTLESRLGRAVTLKEAAESPQAAAQMAKYTETMRTLGIKGSERQLQIITEAIAKGAGRGEELPEAQVALKNALTRGADIQERMDSGLNKMAEELKYSSVLLAINNALTLRQVTGTTNVGGAMSEFIKDIREQGVLNAKKMGITEEGKELPSFESMKEELRDRVSAAVEKGVDVVASKTKGEAPTEKGAIPAMKSMAREFFGNVLGFARPPEPIPAPKETLKATPIVGGLTEAAATPPRMVPTTVPPVPEKELAPVPPPPKRTGATTAEAGAGEKDFGTLKVIVDTAFYDDGMRKVASSEFKKKLKEGDIATVTAFRTT